MVKVRVLVKFRDKTNRAVVHNVGDIIDVAGEARVTSIVERGIGELVAESETTTKEVAEESAKPETKPKSRKFRKG
jgi:ABC-type sulfate transport system substrate-binding protein